MKPSLIPPWHRPAARMGCVPPWLMLVVFALAGAAAPTRAAERRTHQVVLITTDGLRWEEIFRGAEEALLSKEYGSVGDVEALRARFWRPTPEERRQALMPFLWGTVAREGQLWGNRDRGSSVRVTNGQNFSYPGYNEFLSGYPDPAIDSNAKKLNANTNVLEWLNSRPGFAGRVAATVNWDVLPWILNAPRAGFPVWSGFEVPAGTRRLEVDPEFAETVDQGRTIWSGVLLDAFVGHAARHALRTLRPRALYVSYGETDDWAHEGRYERYLWAAHEFDRFVASFWRLLQSIPEYRGTTSLVITSDHGRGPAPLAWKDHGKAIQASAYIWLAVIGPDTPALGERSSVPLVAQAQIAATVAALVGEDFRAAVPRVAAPLTEVIAPR